jgi:hypothetical protein
MQDTRSLAPLQPADFYSMTIIFIDISILLDHLCQEAKDVFLGYYLTIESNIPSSYMVVLKSHYVLCFRSTKSKTFYLQSRPSQF